MVTTVCPSRRLAHSPFHQQTALSPEILQGYGHQAQSLGPVGTVW